ncbi:hypothetical protein CLOBOL_02327 [Enterocloster bolteae ATCC BAA-613]|uniref:Uncharacterized protein n=1 Tax=Enterocloster bolteae (strain ATCC BAA-613 / DSM 15670 / CCUG 46953 / JCM 12243 / WAL 16351) TaxID=411902 RepID=A8RP00_ENTBW|nr:hypothetical protein CLOBOL_02327 [Enterocloster bolteae ATCC BAA-613]
MKNGDSYVHHFSTLSTLSTAKSVQNRAYFLLAVDVL